jgi:hypothetical protein
MCGFAGKLKKEDRLRVGLGLSRGSLERLPDIGINDVTAPTSAMVIASLYFLCRVIRLLTSSVFLQNNICFSYNSENKA